MRGLGTIFDGSIERVALNGGDDAHCHMVAPEDYVPMLRSKQ